MLFVFICKHFFIQIPLRHIQEPVCTTSSKKCKGGHPEDTEQSEAFERTGTYSELFEDEQLTLSELVDIMQKNLESSDKRAYTKVYFKWILLENYSHELLISNEDGKHDIATLKSSIITIPRKYYEVPKDIDIYLQKILF